MKLKKLVLLIISIVALVFIFGFFGTSQSSLLEPMFGIALFVLIIVMFFKFSKLLLKVAILLLIVYLSLAIIPFDKCYGAGENRFQECTCYGLEKTIHIDDYSYSECIGYPTNFECYKFENQTKQNIECGT